MIGQMLVPLPRPAPGDRVTFMGNTGEGKTALARELLKGVPNAIIINTARNPYFSDIATTVNADPETGKYYRWKTVPDEAIMRVGKGRFDFFPSDRWLADEERQDRFWKWIMRCGNRVVYVDEFSDICPSAHSWSAGMQRAIKSGRYRGVGVWGSAQEPIRVPSFCFGQSQHRYVFFLGWDSHRKVADAWFQEPIPWDLIPERSHLFILKVPWGIYGPMKLPDPRFALRGSTSAAPAPAADAGRAALAG